MDYDPLRSVAAIGQPLIGRVRVKVESGFRGLAFALAVTAIIRDQQRRSTGDDGAHMIDAVRQVPGVSVKEDGGDAALRRGNPPGVELYAIAGDQPDFRRRDLRQEVPP